MPTFLWGTKGPLGREDQSRWDSQGREDYKIREGRSLAHPIHDLKRRA